jgi:hypothetical protein
VVAVASRSRSGIIGDSPIWVWRCMVPERGIVW